MYCVFPPEFLGNIFKDVFVLNSLKNISQVECYYVV